MPIRTKALVVDRSTGEPKNLYPQQLHGKPWKLVIETPEGKRKGKLFKRYKNAAKYAKRLKAKYPTEDGYEYTVISRGTGYGPPFSKLPDETLLRINRAGKLWCPYCRKLREYDWDVLWQRNRCPTCKVFEDDFNVRKNNPIYWRGE